MTDVTHLLSQIHSGDPSAAERLLPLVYDELRRLAAAKMTAENPGQTLQATALVHEAYLRLANVEQAQHFDSRGHFFAAAAEAMRRILVENARRKSRQRRGGDRQREVLDEQTLAEPAEDEQLLELDAALDKLQLAHDRAAQVVKLRYFAGLTNEQAAEMLGVSTATTDRDWAYAKVWLLREMGN
jgi:RNA polymerase sigma factor (TIGR02999 family)